MRSHREIYNEFRDLLLKVESSSPWLFNLGIGYSFDTKLRCIEIMQNHVIEKIQELFKTAEKEKGKENSALLEETTKLLPESIAFFEAYLNAFYSFFQIIGKITPYFYDSRQLKKPILVGSFAKQMGYFRKNPQVDSEYSNYLQSSMTWHDELMSDRHAITHNVSAFLGFGKSEMEFITMPKRRIDFFENGKPTKKIEEFILNKWNSLFEYFDFYVKHFSTRQIFVDKDKELKWLTKKIRRN